MYGIILVSRAELPPSDNTYIEILGISAIIRLLSPADKLAECAIRFESQLHCPLAHVLNTFTNSFFFYSLRPTQIQLSTIANEIK